MRIKTYTDIWDSPRTFYSIGDFVLPKPIPLVSLGLFLLVGVIWVPLFFVLFSPSVTSPMTWMIALSAPVGIATIGNKPWFDGKNIFDFLLSQARYFQEPPAWSDMQPDREKSGTVYYTRKMWWESKRDYSDNTETEKTKRKKGR